MARPLRVAFPGALYHVTSRVNVRAAVFLDDGDFARRQEWLRRTVETHGWHVHAFALMTDHHRFVEMPQAMPGRAALPEPSAASPPASSRLAKAVREIEEEPTND